MLLNLARANDYMQRLGMDVIVATSPVGVSYLTGFDCFVYRSFKEYMMAAGQSNRPLKSFAFLPRDGKPSLVTSVSNLSWALGLDVELVPYGSSPIVARAKTERPRDPKLANLMELHRGPMEKSALDALIVAINSLETPGITVGLEFDTMDDESLSRMREKLPDAKLRNATEALRLIRMVKTPGEVDRMRKAAEANEASLRRCMGKLIPGASWGKVRQTYLGALAGKGAYPEHYLYSVNGFDITDYDRASVKKGDVGFIDIGCTYDRYVADTGAAFCVGRWPREASDLYGKLKGQLYDAADMLAPGVGALDVLKRMGDYAARSGIKFIQHGHALGLEPREHPVIMALPNKTITDDFVNVDSNIPLEENMVVNIETPYYALNTASYNLEKTFVITKRGAKSLAAQNREEPFGA